jgi:hypothetical protein
MDVLGSSEYVGELNLHRIDGLDQQKTAYFVIDAQSHAEVMRDG